MAPLLHRPQLRSQAPQDLFPPSISISQYLRRRKIRSTTASQNHHFHTDPSKQHLPAIANVTASSKPHCTRQYREYTKCGCKDIPPPCTCCPYLPMPTNHCDAFWDSNDGLFKRSTLRQTCANCLVAEVVSRKERAAGRYQNAYDSMERGDKRLEAACEDMDRERRGSDRKVRNIRSTAGGLEE